MAEATRDQTGGLSGGLFVPLTWPRCPWGLSLELRGEKEPHWAPTAASPGSFGHGGASGCLAYFDPLPAVARAILGTRTFESWWPRWPTIGAAILAATA